MPGSSGRSRATRAAPPLGAASRKGILPCGGAESRSVQRCLARETKSKEPARSPRRRPARVEGFPIDGFLPEGNSLNPDSVPPLSPALLNIDHRRTCVGQAYGLLYWSTPATMLGAKVTATATYCGHTLRAETDVNDRGQWTGRCVVDGPHFQGTVVLSTPFRAPTAALDGLLTAARRSIDEKRSLAS